MFNQYAEVVERQIKNIAKGSPKEIQLTQLTNSLKSEAAKMAQGLSGYFNDAINESVKLGMEPSQQMLLQVFVKAQSKKISGELDPFTNFTEVNLKAYFIRINLNAIKAFITKTEHSGLFLSQNIWSSLTDTNNTLVGILRDSITAGADPYKTAKLLKDYIQGNGTAQNALIRQLKDGGIKKYYVPKDVKFEALRLDRTETSMAFAEGTYQGGQANPFYKGINWVLSASHSIEDICDDYAAQGFFPAGTEPDIPHPQCMCDQIDVFETPEDAVSSLKNWINDPTSNDRLESWYNTQYLPTLGHV
jgi:hypothetical protein